MQLDIHPVTPSDLDAFLMLWQFYQYHQSHFNTEDVLPNGHFDLDNDYLAEVVNGNEDCAAYLLLVNDQIAGFATVEPTDIADTEMPELADLFVLPKYRQQGVAKRLVETLMLKDLSQWHVAVYQKDTQALRFWDRLFSTLAVARIDKLNPPDTEGFHEFIITNQKISN